MFQRIWSLIIKELLASARDPQTRWVVLFSPPFLLVIYAFAITQEISSVTLGVYTQDRGVEARELISRFEGSPTFEEILYLRRDADIAAAIDSRSVDLVLRIGPDFSRQLERGEPAKVQLILDGRASNAAQILAGYSGRIVQDFNEDQATALGVPTLTKVVTRVWYNPNLDPLWSAVPALFAVLTAIVGFMVSALSIARERELGTFEQLLVSPLRPTEILIGKAVPALMIALASATAMLILGWLVLDVPLRGSLLLLYASMIIYLAAIIGIGLFISSLAATQQQAIIGLFIYMMPAVLLSGYATPVANMPDWLQALNESNPIMHFIVISKAVYMKDAPAELFFHHTWPMAVIAVVTLTAGAWLFRRRVS